jgi:hypothetical protein
METALRVWTGFEAAFWRVVDGKTKQDRRLLRMIFICLTFTFAITFKRLFT